MRGQSTPDGAQVAQNRKRDPFDYHMQHRSHGRQQRTPTEYYPQPSFSIDAGIRIAKSVRGGELLSLL
jgi:hypothetical protein